MIYVITRYTYAGQQTYVDCVMATHKKASEYVQKMNREQGKLYKELYFYQMWEQEIL